MTPTPSQIIFEPPLHVVHAKFAESRLRSVRRRNIQVLEATRRPRMLPLSIKVVIGCCAFFGLLDILRLSA